MRVFGTKSTTYSAPRYSSVWPRWRPKPLTSVTVIPDTPISESAARTSSSLNGLMMAVINFIQELHYSIGAPRQSYYYSAQPARPYALGAPSGYVWHKFGLKGGEEIMIATILIIGGGQAGAQATDTLRRGGFGGRIVLIGDEPWLPYQRPPLSKKYLAGDLTEDRLLIRHQSYYDEHRIDLRLGQPATRIDRGARRVALAGGEELDY